MQPTQHHFNIGGKDISFLSSTLEKAHVKDSALAASLKWTDRTPVFDVDPERFEKWCAPYIRYGRLPADEALECPQERNHLIDIAGAVGLFALADFVCSLEQKPKKIQRNVKFFITVCFNNHLEKIATLEVEKSHLITMHCLDAHCGKIFRGKGGHLEATQVVDHLLLDHDAKLTQLPERTTFVSCKMGSFQLLVPSTYEGFTNWIHEK